MDFRVLGPLEVWAGGIRYKVLGNGRRAVLGALLVRPGRTVPLDQLIEELWGPHPPRRAENAVYAHINRLRLALDQWAPDRHGRGRLVNTGSGYSLHLEPEELDANRFNRLLAQARSVERAAPLRAEEIYRKALALWRGPAFGGTAAGPACGAAAAHLDELRLTTQERLFDVGLNAGLHRDILAELEETVATQPLRERFCAQLMVCLYRCERQAEALEVYQRTRERLADELAIDPSPLLQQHMQAILTQDPALLRPPAPTGVADPPPRRAAANGEETPDLADEQPRLSELREEMIALRRERDALAQTVHVLTQRAPQE
jgi:SARP family transcriptional regulator, regulator of embCAB operon